MNTAVVVVVEESEQHNPKNDDNNNNNNNNVNVKAEENKNKNSNVFIKQIKKVLPTASKFHEQNSISSSYSTIIEKKWNAFLYSNKNNSNNINSNNINININININNNINNNININNNDNTKVVCGICLETYNGGDEVCLSKNSKCEHVFHKDCIIAWLMEDHDDCPNCRSLFFHNDDNNEQEVVDEYEREEENIS